MVRDKFFISAQFIKQTYLVLPAFGVIWTLLINGWTASGATANETVVKSADTIFTFVSRMYPTIIPSPLTATNDNSGMNVSESCSRATKCCS